MKRFLMVIFVLLLVGGAYAQNNTTIKINDVAFEIPAKYQGGSKTNDGYRLDNVFSIRCVDGNVPEAIGLWATESDYREDLTISDHPARYFYQYNPHIKGNHSHIYFVSGESLYEISWVGNYIPEDIKNIIENTPKSQIDEDAFYSALDMSVELYKEQKTNQLNQDGEYNYLEAKSQSQYNNQDWTEDTQFKEILLTYYYGK